jgi:hypothetical protein
MPLISMGIHTLGYPIHTRGYPIHTPAYLVHTLGYPIQEARLDFLHRRTVSDVVRRLTRGGT